MKKLLLMAIAATSLSASAESFSDYFKLSFEDETLSNEQTITVGSYYDPFVQANPEYAGLFPPSYQSQARIKATNVYDENMDIAFVLTPVGQIIGGYQLCFEYNNAPGNCLGPRTENGPVESPDNLNSIAPEGYIILDVDQTNFTDLTPVSFKLELCVMEGGEKIEGTDYLININFTHWSDITLAVEGIEADSASAEYYNLQGVKVAQPEKGGIYIVRKGAKVTKQLF